MRTMNIKANGQSLIAEEVLSVNATVGTIECIFELDDFWSEYPGMEANFMNRNSREVISVSLINNRCEVPWEVLTRAGLIEVALKGVNGDKVERSFPLTVVHLKETIIDGSNSIEPTPDQYGQFVERADERINEIFTTRKDEFKGDKPIKGVDYFDGVDGFSPTATVTPTSDGARVTITDKTGTTTAEIKNGENGEDYVLTESDKKEIAGMVEPYNDGPIREEIAELGEAVGSKAEQSELTDLKESLTQKADKSELDGKVGFEDFASGTSAGVVRFNGYYGVANRVGNESGIPYVVRSTNSEIDERSGYFKPITSSNLDYAVKCAMTGGKGAEWTETEKANARKRIGEPQFELIEEITLTEEVNNVDRSTEPNGTPYHFSSVALLIDVKNAGASRNLNVRIGDLILGVASGLYTTDRITTAISKIYKLNGVAVNFQEASANSGTSQAVHINSRPTRDYIQFVRIQTADNSVPIPSGTVIKIFGIRS